MSESRSTPYVSFVTWGRNDGYTDDYLVRTSKAIACLVRQLEAAALDSEIVVSEWNPPPERPLLVDSLDLPCTSSHVAVRGIVSDPVHHLRFKGADEHGMHSGEAWNVGIRRARGRFILPKASDTFLSAETIARIARRDLDPDTLYRVDRYDVVVPKTLWSLDGTRLLAALEKLPAERNAYIEQSPHWRLRDLHTNASGDFLLMAAAWWHRLRGHPADDTTLTLDGDSLVMHAAAALGVKQCLWPAPCKVYKPRHGHLNNARIAFVWRPWQRGLEAILARLGGAGLAHRARMAFDYPRRRVHNIDSVLAPSIERQFVRPASRWAHGAPVAATQPETWGLADQALDTRALCRAAWE
ncbi:MAG: hypothetical protein J0J01_05785 [Reyranella sp.]|uniref:hypothetical protein n=1 Tax=Reyranella sp. TaxID=1929291 RepID=UPI001AC77716|nr:hypothetical protein [Reyranella sp.]MBN9086399.1 hypothetical protein [Reyranella sp.]